MAQELVYGTCSVYCTCYGVMMLHLIFIPKNTFSLLDASCASLTAQNGAETVTDFQGDTISSQLIWHKKMVVYADQMFAGLPWDFRGSHTLFQFTRHPPSFPVPDLELCIEDPVAYSQLNLLHLLVAGRGKFRRDEWVIF